MKKLIDATTTPLASIFGSGFLVIVPILAGAVGPYSVYAMIGVCALAYAVGGIIRFNIRHAEPQLEDKPSEAMQSLEHASDLALILAYIISVCLYLHILSAFVLTGFGMDGDLQEDFLTTTIIVTITAIGFFKGLEALGALEKWALYITFLNIGLLLLGFAHYDWNAWQSGGGLASIQMPDHNAWRTLTLVAGTLIVVQGFETPRYLSEEFDADTRVSASRWSQIISTGIYVGFVALALPLAATLNGNYDDNSLVKLAGTASALLPVPVIVAAALSQFSAAIADTLAASGNLAESTHEHLKARYGYILVGAGAIGLTWSANTLEIVALASRAFAFYYMLQCLVALTATRSAGRRAIILLVAAMMAFVTIFAVPAS